MTTENPHRRYNALAGEWVLVSPHRTRRPWQGMEEPLPQTVLPPYDAGCYLCPGNTRANGAVNPAYQDVFVFQNDFAALLPSTGNESGNEPGKDGEFDSTMPAAGECRVICYSPQHNKTMAELPQTAIERVAQTWQEQYRELAQQYQWVQIFENKGELMGCSNPHPHGQIWACDYLPNEAAKEMGCQARYYQQHGSALLDDYAAFEMGEQTRVVAQNADWLWLVPFWAVWPFETLLLCKRPAADFSALTNEQLASLAGILKTALTTYDRVFNCAFPYSMGWHNAPGGDETAQQHWRLHAHFYPPLLRSAGVRKFMVGFEMLSEAQRDIMPEQAAETLRAASHASASGGTRK